MSSVPRIVITGLCNAGKSSVFNLLLQSEVTIVHSQKGTTTDPVTRRWELPGFGPVALTDTAGLNDTGGLGLSRHRTALDRLAAADLVLMISPGNQPPQPRETEILRHITALGKPWMAVLTHAARPVHPKKLALLESGSWPFEPPGAHGPNSTGLSGPWPADPQNPAGDLPPAVSVQPRTPHRVPEEVPRSSSAPFGCQSVIQVDNPTGQGYHQAVQALQRFFSQGDSNASSPLEGLLEPGDTIILVTPQDSGAPAGRLIKPQAETLRDALDRDCMVLTLGVSRVSQAYRRLIQSGAGPRLVITDSQAFDLVRDQLPDDQPLTSFSLIYARIRGDLPEFYKGISRLESLKDGDRVLILENCKHHRQNDDIATRQIPALLRHYTRADLEFSFSRHLHGDANPRDYALAVHCGGCMAHRQEILRRQRLFARCGVGMTNFGMVLAHCRGGILDRAMAPLLPCSSPERRL
ncbi:hypothetical protein DC28_07225 [Spirochaeta lutea]|uniref:G domain-containing protein n=2 Tax=Spirochaeta lutea TaxID=1480694 RepID=A0A098QXN1_9SPIO|nr:hypothetical protein DC28_07225 [Spirochaeta lutea]